MFKADVQQLAKVDFYICCHLLTEERTLLPQPISFVYVKGSEFVRGVSGDIITDDEYKYFESQRQKFKDAIHEDQKKVDEFESMYIQILKKYQINFS